MVHNSFMSDLTADDWMSEAETFSSPAPLPPRPKTDWVLMGDILTARDGVPVQLIEWRRAKTARHTQKGE